MRKEKGTVLADGLLEQLEAIENPVDRQACELYLKVGPTEASRILQLQGGPVYWPSNITRMARQYGLPTGEPGRPSKIEQFGPLIRFMKGCEREVQEITARLPVSESTVRRALAM